MHKTALHATHAAAGARLIEFGGWDMPVQYTGIVDEHRCVRERAGIFDLQHMGRLRLTGPDRAAALDALLSNDVAATKPGRARYALVTDDAGGVIDDVIYYVLPEAIVVVVNASNREAVLDWMRPRLQGDVRLDDCTHRWAMLAVQGPKALELLQPLTDRDLTKLKYYRCQGGMVLGEPCFLARTGYTGEVGLELVFDATQAEFLWEALLHHGKGVGLQPCGLGARDTLRTEAGMPLYGHELDRATNPLEAGLDFAVKLSSAAFPGVEVLRQTAEAGPQRRLLGFEVDAKRIPRQGAKILRNETEVGVVTSGTKSPTLDKVICMGYVPSADADATDGWAVEVSSKHYPLHPTSLPFYSRTRG